MKRLSSFIASFIASLIAAGALLTPAPAEELFAQIGTIKEGLSAITGLAFTRDVPCLLYTSRCV